MLCDTALPKPVCALTGSPRPDLAMQPAADLAGVDLEGVDLSAIATDLSTAPSVDLAKRD